MASLNFYRGKLEDYKNPANREKYTNAIYFATDTKEIWMNGGSYGNISKTLKTELVNVPGKVQTLDDSVVEIRAALKNYVKDVDLDYDSGTLTVKYVDGSEGTKEWNLKNLWASTAGDFTTFDKRITDLEKRVSLIEENLNWQDIK